jgi:phosphonate transport system substrate-binding protein
MGIKATSQTNIYKNTADLLDAVKKGDLIIVSLPALEYLQIRDRAPMAPLVVASSNAGKGRRFVLVVRHDSSIRSLADLRGKSITLLLSSKHEISQLWLSVMLLKEGFRDRDAFFRQTKESTSASQAMMAVFFKQVDAAIISRGAYETNTTLNPQMGKQLSIISESRSLLGDVTCVPDMVEEPLKRAIEKAALNLHESTVGKQMFTLFQIDRTIPFAPAHLDGIEELLRERDHLLAKRIKRQ